MAIALAAEGTAPKTVMIDATYLKAHRTAPSLSPDVTGDDYRGRAGDPGRPMAARTAGPKKKGPRRGPEVR
ncbi:hypothetical protein GCM10011392_18630 [Wenxinia marina]|nr:hypothetical protein GCM10011392_18630 [Wenxinia marina]